mgnify:CR=1 FL=1
MQTTAHPGRNSLICSGYLKALKMLILSFFFIFCFYISFIATFTKTIMTPDINMYDTYDYLVNRALKRYTTDLDNNILKNNQLFIGIGGGPGSGKSTLATAVKNAINLKENKELAVVLPMDGFHYSRLKLKQLGEKGVMIGDPSGTKCLTTTFEDLIARRGSPWTFDSSSIIKEFTKVREDGFGSLPIYSREESDPVDDGVKLLSSHGIVLLEGNYLLCYNDPEWSPLKDIFDEKWYIQCNSMDDQRSRLIDRHLETWTEAKTKMFGAGRKGATIKADSNDVLNAIWVERMSKDHADLIVHSK